MKTIEVPAVAGSRFEGKSVKVEYDKNDVTITWLCGGSYEFTKEGLARALENFQAISKVPEIVYRDTADKSYGKYIAKLTEDGEFVGDETVFNRTMKVPWKDFEAALQTALGVKPKAKPRARKK